MNQGNTPGAPARLDWLVLSDDLEAVFVAARRITVLARLQAAEHQRLRAAGDLRAVHNAWGDANHLLAAAAAELDQASRHLAGKASAILGLAMDAEDQET